MNLRAKLSIFLLCAVLLASILPRGARALDEEFTMTEPVLPPPEVLDSGDRNVLASGSCGDNLTWELTRDGMLSIQGSGDMYDYLAESAPWQLFVEEIYTASLSSGVTSIGSSAFYGCTRLESVSIPDTVTLVGADAFADCTALDGLILPSGVYYIGESAFSGCKSLTSLTIPEGITILGDYLFYNCIGLSSVQIPDSVESIGKYAFSLCTSLTEIALPSRIAVLSDGIFSDCSALASIPLPASLQRIGSRAFYNCSALNQIQLPDTLEEIGTYAFFGCGLTQLNCPEGLTKFGSSALAQCRKLESFAFPSGICAVPNSLFSGCSALREVLLPDGITGVGEYAFADCSALTQIALPDSITQLGAGAFSHSGLETIAFPAGLQEISPSLLRGTRLTSVTIPEQITAVSQAAFSDCARLFQVVFAGESCRLGSYAFAYCGALKDIDLPSALSEIPEGCFCFSGPEQLSLPSGIASIGSQAFGYGSLSRLVFTGAAPAIAADAFSGVTAEIQYTPGAGGWTEDLCQNYGGALTWTAPYTLKRIAGENRGATARKAADAMKQILGVDSFDAILYASGSNFPDALSGSYLAARFRAPILLYRTSSFPEDLAYIRKNLAPGGTVYLLGSTAAIPAQVEDTLQQAGICIRRLGGETRIDTNLEVLKASGFAGGEILVCTSLDFADSLSASSAGKPIFLVNNRRGNLTQAQTRYLAGLSGCSFRIIGGTAVVSEALEAQLRSYGSVERISGSGRYETSVKAAECFYPTAAAAFFAYGQDFPDGLCGGPLAYLTDAPLILTQTGKEDWAQQYIKDNGITRGTVLGGKARIPDAVMHRIFS